MDILIKGMDMPKEMECIEILLFSNGHCGFRKHERDEWVEAKAVALPEHGDLIDRNELPLTWITDHKLDGHTVVEFEDVKNAPVIVEATE